MDGSPQMWIQSDILLKKAILEAGQSILPLPLVRNFRRLTYQRYRCSLDPVETVARNDRRSNYRDQHFELGYSRWGWHQLKSNLARWSAWCGVWKKIRFPPINMATREKKEEGEEERGDGKSMEKEDLAASLCPIHPYTLVPVIKQSGLINGDWLLDPIRVNPGADSALLLKFSSHSSWTEWNDSQTLCANTLTTPGIGINPLRCRKRERVCFSPSFFSFDRGINRCFGGKVGSIIRAGIEQHFASRIISNHVFKKLDENWDWTGIEFNNLSIVHALDFTFRFISGIRDIKLSQRYDHSKVNERGDKLSEFVQILNQTNINRVYTILDDISINNSAIFFSFPPPLIN